MPTISSTLKMMDGMSGPLKSIMTSMNLVIRAFEQMQTVTERNTNVGQMLNAAKKQIASAEAEIRRQIEQSEKAQNRFNQSIRQGEKSASGLFNSVRNIAATYLTFQGARSLGASTIGAAMQQQQIIDTFAARTGNEALGKAIYNQVVQEALRLGQDVDAALAGTQSFMSATMNPQQLVQLNKLAMRLSKLNPAEGLEGAAFSLKELMSGDYTSIAERFNISRSLLQNSAARQAGLKGDIEGFIRGMDELLNQQNMTEEAFEKMLDSPAAKWNAILNRFKFNMTQAGEQAMQSLVPAFDRINAALESGKFDSFFQSLSVGLSNAVNFALQFASAVGNVYNFFANNWSIIEPIIWGIVTAFGAWLIVSRWQTITQGLLAVKTAILTMAIIAQTVATQGLAAAWRMLTAAQKANIFIFLISAIVALVAWLINLWKTNDNFAAALMRAWNTILNFFDKIPGYFWQFVEWLMGPFEWWAKSVGKIYDVVINGIIKGINKVLELVNKITGSSYEIAAEFSFENVAKNLKEYAQIQKTEAFARAAQKAAEREQKVLDFLNERAAKRAQQEAVKQAAQSEGFDFSKFNVGRVDEVGKIRDTVDISSEDLKMMRELAEMKSIQNFVSLRPSVRVQTGPISKDVDIDTVIARIDEKLTELIASSARGVFNA